MHRRKYVPYTGGPVSDRIVTIEVQPLEILSPPQRAATDLDRVHAIQPEDPLAAFGLSMDQFGELLSIYGQEKECRVKVYVLIG